MKRFFSAFCVLAVASAGAASAAPPSATTYYERAVAAMQALPQLPDITYTIVANSENGTISIHPAKGGGIAFTVGPGPNNTQRVSAAYRAVDEKVALTFPGGKHGVGHVGILTPSWEGAYAFMHRGFLGAPKTPTPGLTPTPNLSASPLPTLPTIVVVRAFGSGFYRVTDNGAASCPSGAPGHALHLIARSDPQAHPLTDVIVDLHTMRFCAMRFAVNQSFGGVFGGTGFIQLNFASAGKYWIERHVLVDIEARALGIALKHIVLRFAYSAVAFPQSLPASLFATSPPQPARR